MKKPIFALAAVMLTALLCSGCAPEQRFSHSEGSILSLDEAYAEGCLTGSDLQSIAYYYHTRFGESEQAGSFTSAPKTPASLAEETICRIKRTYLDEVANVPDGSFDRVYLDNYFGTYGGCAVVGLRSDYIAIDPLLYPEYTVGGVTFYDYDPSAVSVWRPDAWEQ